MQDQRLHRDRVAAFNIAVYGRDLVLRAVNLVPAEATTAVTPRQHPQPTGRCCSDRCAGDQGAFSLQFHQCRLTRPLP